MSKSAPSSLDRALAIHVAALAVLGAIFVGFRHETTAIPAFAALGAVAAFVLTDVLRLVRLNRWIASAIIVGAVGWSLRDFVRVSAEEKLMAIASMLCYLQVVLLLQDKTSRIYWQLIVLSTLEVVVAAALDLGPQFGLLLALYAVIALAAMVLLCLYRETNSLAVEPRPSPAPSPASWQSLLAKPSVAASPPADVAAAVTPWVLVRQTASLALATLLLAVAFFYSTPRLGEGSWLGGRTGRSGLTGFKPEVRLDERVRIEQSNQVVMRVALTKIYPERRSIELISEPYFHGALLSEFTPDEAGGRWLPWRPPVSTADRPRERLGGMMRANLQTTTTSLVREDIVMEASTTGLRFAIMPTQPYTEGLSFAYGGPQQRNPDSEGVPRQQRYSVVTPAISSDRQVRAIPNPNRLLSLLDGIALAEEEERTLALDRARYPRLMETAAEVIRQHNLGDGSALNKALALERHFLAAGAYRYSLNLDFAGEADLDPLEDFVANHRTGSCQHFASALALMLRSQGIPARLVVGYKGGDFNSVGHYYVVEQRHAHSWVEAWVPTDDVPLPELAGTPSDGGAWYRLDPTPGRENQVAIDKEGLGTRIAQAFDYVDLLWRDYVLSLNKNRQDEFVYDPLTAKASILPTWIESRSFQRWLRRLSTQWGLDLQPGRERGGARVFEASLAVLVTGGLILLLIAVQGLRFVWLATARCRTRTLHTTHSTGQTPRFYRRLERVLARLPVTRRPGETPRELAAAAGPRLAAVEGAALTAHVPDEIVSAYYRVRFGGHGLDNQEAESIEQALAALSAAVRQKKKM